METMIDSYELAIRWRVSLKSLNQWRWNGRGPKFVKIGNSILYGEDEIKAFEEKNTKYSTAFSNQNNGRDYERGPLVMQSPIRKKQLAQKWGEEKKAWVEQQKANLKAGALENVFSALEPYLEPSGAEDCDAPVRRCYRYLDNRRNQLDYAGAIKNGLPIGSGEVESAHRYVIQQRLKITGAWWKEENAADMLALRTNRVNDNWEQYWESKKTA